MQQIIDGRGNGFVRFEDPNEGNDTYVAYETLGAAEKHAEMTDTVFDGGHYDGTVENRVMTFEELPKYVQAEMLANNKMVSADYVEELSGKDFDDSKVFDEICTLGIDIAVDMQVDEDGDELE